MNDKLRNECKRVMCYIIESAPDSMYHDKTYGMCLDREQCFLLIDTMFDMSEEFHMNLIRSIVFATHEMDQVNEIIHIDLLALANLIATKMYELDIISTEIYNRYLTKVRESAVLLACAYSFME